MNISQNNLYKLLKYKILKHTIEEYKKKIEGFSQTNEIILKISKTGYFELRNVKVYSNDTLIPLSNVKSSPVYDKKVDNHVYGPGGSRDAQYRTFPNDPNVLLKYNTNISKCGLHGHTHENCDVFDTYPSSGDPVKTDTWISFNLKYDMDKPPTKIVVNNTWVNDQKGLAFEIKIELLKLDRTLIWSTTGVGKKLIPQEKIYSNLTKKSFKKRTDFVCKEGLNLPIRCNDKHNKMECLSKDGTNCLWALNQDDCWAKAKDYNNIEINADYDKYKKNVVDCPGWSDGCKKLGGCQVAKKAAKKEERKAAKKEEKKAAKKSTEFTSMLEYTQFHSIRA
jgi:hypothetical protein